MPLDVSTLGEWSVPAYCISRLQEPASGPVYSYTTEACSAPGHVYPTQACAAPCLSYKV
jgi:hypothetical protein